MPAFGLPPFSMGEVYDASPSEPGRQMQKHGPIKKKTQGGITPRAGSLGLNVNPSMVFVVLLQLGQIYACALPPPTQQELF